MDWDSGVVATPAIEAANAAGETGQYHLVMMQLFKTQHEWERNGNVDAAVAQVLPPGAMQKVRDLVAHDTKLDDTVASDVAAGINDQLNQTPTLIIVRNGKREKIAPIPSFSILKSYLDQVLTAK